MKTGIARLSTVPNDPWRSRINDWDVYDSGSITTSAPYSFPNSPSSRAFKKQTTLLVVLSGRLVGRVVGRHDCRRFVGI
jgi:hypothetical protein